MAKPETRWGGKGVATPKMLALTVQRFGPWVANVAKRAWATAMSVRYKHGGRIPGSPGYDHSKFRFIDVVLQNAKWMAMFRDGRALPEHFGSRLDERVIEKAANRNDGNDGNGIIGGDKRRHRSSRRTLSQASAPSNDTARTG